MTEKTKDSHIFPTSQDLSIAHMSMIDGWKKSIVHSSQHATHGGIKIAVYRMNVYIEKSLAKGNKVIRLVVDFSEAAIHGAIWRQLVARRPKSFGGLTDIAVHGHRKLLTSLDSYIQKILLRIWTGCALTQAHQHMLHPKEPAFCPCGAERQTLAHPSLSWLVAPLSLPLCLSLESPSTLLFLFLPLPHQHFFGA